MANLFSKSRGKGDPVILLHGFPFNQKVWGSFAEKLAENFEVHTVDLPGFGGSPALELPFTIDQVGNEVLSWIRDNNVHHSVLIGHSLGGYVALSMANKAPELFNSLVLFHSTAYADNEEKKQSRNKVLEFIDKNGVVAFTSNFIAPLFVNQQHPAIEKVKSIAIEARIDVVKGYTIAMRDRMERTDVLKGFVKPILFLAGGRDTGIPVESVNKQAAISLTSEVHILSEVAHMGMFENEKKCLEVIESFIRKNTVTK